MRSTIELMTDSSTNVVAGPDLTAAQLHDLLKLRVDVFVVEQECVYPELDGRDMEPSTEHLWLADADGVTVALRLLADPAGRRIGRVVTREDKRGFGLAGRLLDDAIAHVGAITTVLDAQSHLEAFYRAHGYEVTGAEFIEDGIPHLPMTRTATRTSTTKGKP